LIWSLALLMIFFTVIRTLGERTRPATPALDCDHFTAGDTPALERCLELRSDDVELMTSLGGIYEAAAQWDRAEAVYRRALSIDPQDGDLRVRLGEVLLHRGDRAGARREAKAALAVQPGGTAVLDLIRRAGVSTAGSAGGEH
jgi:tetratricopeptide (TPR) repeat protein